MTSTMPWTLLPLAAGSLFLSLLHINVKMRRRQRNETPERDDTLPYRPPAGFDPGEWDDVPPWSRRQFQDA